jgi:septum formation topological specificity factor MinE
MIFNRAQQKNLERLQNVLISDKQFSPQKVEKVLKSDMYNLLSNYCTLSPEDISIKVEVQKDGSYKFLMIARSGRLKVFGSLPDDYQ